MWKHRWTLWALILTGWILIGLSWTLNYYFFSDHYVSIFSVPPTLNEMLVWELPYWILWAALSPVIFWLTRRFRLGAGIRMRNWAVHLSACILLSIGHRALYLGLGWLLHVAAYQRLSSIYTLYKFLFLFNLPTGFMSYGTVLLASYLIDYYRRYQEEELKASQLETRLAQTRLQATAAELSALKMQLQPHFLFNTLNSISALLEENVEAAEQMLARLGDFLRLTLESSGANEVPLQEELAFLKVYLDIERVRFEDRMKVSIDVEPDTLGAMVPNLILQPLVENAIKHGIALSDRSGHIDIRAAKSDGLLKLQVSNDDGDPQSGTARRDQIKEGRGLSNVRARLQQLYGEAHRLDIDSAAGGVRVTVEIPFIKQSVAEPATIPASQ